jgi:hypothetical protein
MDLSFDVVAVGTFPARQVSSLDGRADCFERHVQILAVQQTLFHGVGGA